MMQSNNTPVDGAPDRSAMPQTDDSGYDKLLGKGVVNFVKPNAGDVGGDQQQEPQQAGNPEKLELGENISGVDYISVEIKHDNGETSVKGRVKPTDIGFVIYNENQ
jgi:hypothetical protein